MAFVTHILPEDVLFAPKHGSIQYHPSLLPRHRGRSAMHWAIRMGDETTGVTIFWTDKGIDTGPVLLQRACPVGPGRHGGVAVLRQDVPDGRRDAGGVGADGARGCGAAHPAG